MMYCNHSRALQFGRPPRPPFVPLFFRLYRCSSARDLSAKHTSTCGTYKEFLKITRDSESCTLLLAFFDSSCVQQPECNSGKDRHGAASMAYEQWLALVHEQSMPARCCGCCGHHRTVLSCQSRTVRYCVVSYKWFLTFRLSIFF